MSDTLVLPAVFTVLSLAAYLDTSTKTIRRMDQAGRLPSPIRIGRGLRWRRDEIDAWLAAGCPARDEWRGQRTNTKKPSRCRDASAG
ncbi:MAG: helix-turn-helix domain-containing protein [Pirellulaceae bacterium]|nr:helix-turn-helix domain-containing protein [Pirellulaceae bacterium]